MSNTCLQRELAGGVLGETISDEDHGQEGEEILMLMPLGTTALALTTATMKITMSIELLLGVQITFLALASALA